MRRFKTYVLIAALLTAGCASVPEEQAGSASSPAAEGETQAAVAPEELDEIETIELRASALDRSELIRCRDILMPGSNVIATRCMTEANWERYERFRTMQAQEFLRALQNGTYRY